MNFILIALGGALGAVSRYIIGKQFPVMNFPLSTLTVNILGSLLLGFLFAKLTNQSPLMYLFFGVGFCGAFTTFSTFSLDFIQLLQKGNIWMGFIYLFGTVLLSALGTISGFYLAK